MEQWCRKRKRFGTFTTAYADISIIEGLNYRFNAGVELRTDVYGEFYASKTNNNLGGLSTCAESYQLPHQLYD